ncbi:MAG: S9 family peptidase [Bacteroidales bacterium]|nr:S9 family peptidase [Bacteroidales bacterium]
MSKKNILIVFLVGFTLSGMAQDKIFELVDVFTSGKMYPQNLRQLQWIPSTCDYVYVKDNDLVKATAPSDKTTVWVTSSDIHSALEAKGEKATRGFPTIVYWTSKESFYAMANGKIIHYDIAKKQIDNVMETPENAENIEYDYKHAQMAYTIGNDLYVTPFGKDAKRVNQEQVDEVKFGHAPHRVEFGIENGCYWSPSGKNLAFYRMDESMVDDYPLVNTTTRIAALQNEKYPMAGLTSHQVKVGIYNAESGNIVYMKTGEPLDQYLTCVTFSPDEKYLFIGLLNREQNHLKMNQYDALSGDYVKTLFEEKHERYVEPSDPLYFLPNSNTQFLWVSQKSGWKHLHLYDITGNEIKQLTSGNWVVKSFSGFDEKGQKAFFMSNKDEITGSKMYVVDIKTGKISNISTEEGTHLVQPSFDGMYFLDRYTSLHIPSIIALKDTKAKARAILLYDSTSLSEYNLPEVSVGKLQNKNGDDLYYRLIKPIDFDPNKKYPVFVYVYGGPHSQMVTNSWLSGGHFLHYMAQKGYVVFTLDNRGTANRGFEFESTIHRRVGTVEVEDQMVGVEFLKSLPYVDQNRFSVDGWSYGGFMTLTLKLQYPEVFKVATAGGPVVDWKYYEVMYGERYMDTPEENEEGYKNNSLLNRVKNIDGHIMIIHGAMDPTVVWQNSLQFLTEAIKANKQIDYFVYPTHEHNVRGIDRVHLWNKIANYHQTFNK